jgi:acid phosphatase family membrane protein YuiD
MATLLAGGIAQLVKLTLAIRRVGTVDRRAFLNLPGMPSTWAAMCGALCTLMLRREGLASDVVAVTVAFSCLVLYDALKLRRSAGRQARLLNAIARDLEQHRKEDAGRHLRELLGETPAQVLAGLGLGIAVGVLWSR